MSEFIVQNTFNPNTFNPNTFNPNTLFIFDNMNNIFTTHQTGIQISALITHKIRLYGLATISLFIHLTKEIINNIFNFISSIQMPILQVSLILQLLLVLFCIFIIYKKIILKINP